MANQNAPFGMGAITRTGSDFIGVLNRYHISSGNATAMAVGDPVISSGTADADGVPSIARAAAGDAVRGYIVGFEYKRETENLPNLRPASTEAYAYVIDDPNARIVIQEDSVGGALAATDVGSNVDFAVSAANTVTGRSQVMIDSDSVATTNTLPLKILELYQSDDNEIGDHARWVCSFNTHELKADTGSTGV